MESHYYHFVLYALCLVFSALKLKKADLYILILGTVFTYFSADLVIQNNFKSLFLTPFIFILCILHYRILNKVKVELVNLYLMSYISLFTVDLIYGFQLNDLTGIGGNGLTDSLVVYPLCAVLLEYLLQIWDRVLIRYNTNKKEKI